jgi:ribonuclease Z
MMSQIDPRPRLTAAVHFTVADDTVECAMNSIKQHFPDSGYPELGKDIIFPTDRMVVILKKGENGNPPKIEQFIADVSEYTFGPLQNVYQPLAAPKYPSPKAQLDTTNEITPGPDSYCENGY